MAETRIIGNDGSVTFLSGHNVEANSWSLTINAVVSDTTAYGDTFRTFRGGVKQWSGSVSGFMSFDATSTAPSVDDFSGTPAAITLTAATGCTYGGSVIISNVVINTTKTGDATISFDLQGSGTLTETWDETA